MRLVYPHSESAGVVAGAFCKIVLCVVIWLAS